jgi:hypothetical protein
MLAAAPTAMSSAAAPSTTIPSRSAASGQSSLKVFAIREGGRPQPLYGLESQEGAPRTGLTGSVLGQPAPVSIISSSATEVAIVPFESVYRVSTRNSVPTEADVDSLSRELGMELPLGYREYVTAFGRGTMSYFLVVKMPSEIRSPDSREEKRNRELLAWVAQSYRQRESECGLVPEDIEQAIIFAYASAEAPIWIASRGLGTRLFEQVEGDVFEIRDGFYGLVEHCTAGQRHEFPFFEPRNGRRRMRQLYVRAGVGREGFVEAMARRWGHANLRCSRNSKDELYPHYFVAAIEGHIELHLDPQYNRLPGDSFFVRACYDIDGEADLAAFVEPLLLPGGGPHEFIGASW